MSSGDFFNGMMEDALEQALDNYAENLHAKAALTPRQENTRRYSCAGSGRSSSASRQPAPKRLRGSWSAGWGWRRGK